MDPRVTALARPRSNCIVNYRAVLSSERAHHIKKPAIVRQKTKNLGMGSRWEPGTKTDWPTDCRS
jgi:hypothetical protein